MEDNVNEGIFENGEPGAEWVVNTFSKELLALDMTTVRALDDDNFHLLALVHSSFIIGMLAYRRKLREHGLDVETIEQTF